MALTTEDRTQPAEALLESLRAELPTLHFGHLLEGERDVVEGSFHTGWGAVVQAIARRPGPGGPEHP